MDAWSLPKARPISCNDCPAFQRHHMSIPWFAETFTLLLNLINTTFREKIYTRWCCIDRLSWQGFSGLGHTVNDKSCYKELSLSLVSLAIQPQRQNEKATNKSPEARRFGERLPP